MDWALLRAFLIALGTNRRTLVRLGQFASVCLGILYFPGGPIRAMIALALLFTTYYYFVAAAAARIYSSNSPSEQRILRHMPCVRGRGYYPTPFLINHHVQTLFSAVGRPLPKIDFQRQLNWDVFPDGEVCVVDWAFPNADARAVWEHRNKAAGRASVAPLKGSAVHGGVG